MPAFGGAKTENLCRVRGRESGVTIGSNYKGKKNGRETSTSIGAEIKAQGGLKIPVTEKGRSSDEGLSEEGNVRKRREVDS